VLNQASECSSEFSADTQLNAEVFERSGSVTPAGVSKASHAQTPSFEIPGGQTFPTGVPFPRGVALGPSHRFFREEAS
jgi:hypothetical protein